jgi:hypothetical protein
MTIPENAYLKLDLPENGGHKQLDSHVQAPTPVYGEPNGPRPASMFRRNVATPMPRDRERNGFIGGRDEVGLGDIVGSGPEEWERKPKSQTKHGVEGPPDEASD